MFRQKKVRLEQVPTMGGMPSAHTALVTALSVSIGLKDGWSSSLFAISSCMSIVIIYDATGIRRAVGLQAECLNHIMTDIIEGKPFPVKRLNELLGHTPLQVIIGGLIGALVSYSFYLLSS